MVVIHLFFILTTIVNCAMWKKENIQEIRTMKSCLDVRHANLVNKLFPVASVDREQREAIALDYAGRLIKSGTPVCDALAKMTVRAEQLIERKYNEASPQDQPRWRHTLDSFKKHSEETRTQCDYLGNEGPLSAMNRCLTSVYHRATVSLVVSQYREEEQGFKP